MPDTHSYWHLGQRLASGQPYEYGGPDFRVFRAPGYPLLLAGLFRVLGTDASMLSARLVGAVLGTLAVAGVMWLTLCIFGPGAPDSDWTPHEARLAVVLAGLLATVYPGAIATSIFVLAEALFCPLFIVHLACWVRAHRRERGRALAWAAGGGVAAGLAILTRPSWLLFIPFVVGLLVLLSRARWRHVSLGACMVLSLSLVMSPWWVRNYRAVGQFVPTTLQVGASLYDGWNPAATGASNMPFSTPAYRAQKAEDAAAGRDAFGFEVRLDQRLRREAWAWARAHPGQVVQLAGHKFLRLWNIWPNADEFRSWMLRVLVCAGYLPLLVLGGVGLVRWWRGGWPYLLCALPAVYYTCLHMIFVSSIRYRQPALMVWLILAAAALATKIGRASTPRQSGAAPHK